MTELIAKIKHDTEIGNIVYTFNTDYSYTQFANLKSKCEVCGEVRYRNVSYIVKVDDKLIQVGSSCLKKVLPRELTLLEKAIIEANVNSTFDDIYLNVGKSRYFNYRYLLLSYIHTAKHPKMWNGCEALDWYKDFKDLITDKDVQELEKMLAWYETTSVTNNFVHNIRCAIATNEQDYISNYYISIVKWAYATYQDYKIAELSKGLEGNEFTIKEVIIKEKYKDYNYNYRGIEKIVYRFIDTNDNIIDFDTSSIKDYTQWIGKKVTCTIKSKYDSKKGKITKISRLKLIKGE